MFKSLFSLLSQFAPLLLTLGLAGASYWLALQSELNLLQQNTDKAPGVPDYYFSEFRTQEVRFQGERMNTTTVGGQRADYFEASHSLVITQPVAIRLDNGQIQTVLKAQDGVYDVEKDRLFLAGQVNITRSGIDQPQTPVTVIQTEQLTFDGQQSKLSSDTTTTIEQPGKLYQTSTLLYDNQTGQFDAEGGVKLKLETQTR